MSSTVARAGLAADVKAHAAALAKRHEAACEAMVATFFRRDGILPTDVTPPNLPEIPQLPPEYEAVVEMGGWLAARWAGNADVKTAIHRDKIPTRIAHQATPAMLVAGLRALERYVEGVEKLAVEYREAAEMAVARHVEEQEGYVRELSEIVAAARAEREREEKERLEAERLKAEREKAEAAEREAWIREYGSPRLRRLLEEGIEHGTVYRDERLALERPDWSYNDKVITREPRNAPMAALELLDEARKTVPDARLVYWVTTLPCGCEEDCYCEAKEVRGYTCEADFLGRKIVYRVHPDGTPPVPAGSDA